MSDEAAEAEKFSRYHIELKAATVHSAAQKGDLQQLDKHVTEGIHQGNPESVTLQQRESLLGMMPLHIACEHGQLEAVEYLIKKRVDIDAGDYFRVTPLHLACIENHYEIARVLLKSRATVNVADLEGDLPIHWAATKGHPDVIELLVSNKSPVDAINKSQWTPLHRAVYNNRKEGVAALTKMGASLSVRNKDGNTPLHLACFMGYLDVVELLLSLGAKMDVLNNRNQTPYDVCINDGAREQLEKWGYKYVMSQPKDAPASPSTASASAAAAASVASVTAGVNGMGLSSSTHTGKVHHRPKAAAAAAAASDDFPDLGGALSTSFTSGAIMQSRISVNGVAPGGDSKSSTRASIPNLSPSPWRSEASTPMGAAAAGSGAGRSPSLRVLGDVGLARPGSSGGSGGGMLVGSPPAQPGQLRLGQGPPLPPIGASSNRGGGSSSSKAAVGAAAAPGSDDYMDAVREENRRLASQDSLNGSRRRPTSANKKFLARYNLDKMNLFAPT